MTEGRLFGADADMAWRGEPDEADRAVEVAASSPGVEAVGVRWGLDADLELAGPDGSLTGTADALDAVSGWAGPTIVRGRAPAGQDEVALGRHILDELGVDLADTVSLSGPDGRTSLTVVGEVVAWGSDEVDEGIEVSMDGLRRLSDAVCAGVPYCVPSVHYVVARLDGSGGEADTLEEAGFAPVPLPSEIDNLQDAGPLPWLLAAFLAVLAVAGLLHAVVSVLRGRRHDIAIGRALGLTTAEARSAARWAAATMVVAGVAVGVPLGIVVGRLVWAATADRLGVLLAHGLPWWAPVVTAVGAIAVALALAELPARRSATVPPTLRAE